jgi:hypothetical protein
MKFGRFGDPDLSNNMRELNFIDPNYLVSLGCLPESQGISKRINPFTYHKPHHMLLCC